MNTIWFTDLDNTMIHSFRHMKTNDICIEHRFGKEQGYIDNYIYKKLKDLYKNEELQIIPTTTRSFEQYCRIEIFNSSQEYVITTNGGKIYKYGIEYLDYTQYIQDNFKEQLIAIQNLYQELNKLDIMEIRYIDSMFIHINSCEGKVNQTDKLIKDILKRNNKYSGLEIDCIGKKIYIGVADIDKSLAMKYILREIGAKQVIASGDSAMDFNMFEIADKVYTLIEHKDRFKTKGVVVYTDTDNMPGYRAVLDLMSNM